MKDNNASVIPIDDDRPSGIGERRTSPPPTHFIHSMTDLDILPSASSEHKHSIDEDNDGECIGIQPPSVRQGSFEEEQEMGSVIDHRAVTYPLAIRRFGQSPVYAPHSWAIPTSDSLSVK